MIKHNQNGAISGVLLALIGVSLLLVVALGFGFWAFAGYQDYKTNSDKKVAAAVVVAKANESSDKDKIFAEVQKQPLKTYNSPQAYGSLVVNYPKSWSGYVDDSGNGTALVDGYFSPNVVPSISQQGSVFALRVQVLAQSYAQVVQQLSSGQQPGALASTAYSLPKVPSAVGVKVTGKISNDDSGSSGTMVVLPLRDKTLEISTEGTQYINDFNTYILPNFSFSP